MHACVNVDRSIELIRSDLHVHVHVHAQSISAVLRIHSAVGGVNAPQMLHRTQGRSCTQRHHRNDYVDVITIEQPQL